MGILPLTVDASGCISSKGVCPSSCPGCWECDVIECEDASDWSDLQNWPIVSLWKVQVLGQGT
jgi:hypothetical protein